MPQFALLYLVRNVLRRVCDKIRKFQKRKQQICENDMQHVDVNSILHPTCTSFHEVQALINIHDVLAQMPGTYK